MVSHGAIKNSVNVITGCGSGLGTATLKWFLEKNSGPILAIDRHFEPNFKEELGLTRDQEKLIKFAKHDTFSEDVDKSLSEFVSKNGTIHNLINVAGVHLSYPLMSNKGFRDYSRESSKNLTDFNTVGTFNMIRLVSKYMINSSKGKRKTEKFKTRCIVNTSCFSTYSPTKGQTFSVASKSAIDSMTLCIARELGPFNIRCVTIDVGLFSTKLTTYQDDKIAPYIAAHSLCPKRLGRPEEFAHLVNVIIENNMLNGCSIKLDAGVSIPHTW